VSQSNPGGFVTQSLQTRPTRRIVEQTLRADGYPIILAANTRTDPSPGFIRPLKVEHGALLFGKNPAFLKAFTVGHTSRDSGAVDYPVNRSMGAANIRDGVKKNDFIERIINSIHGKVKARSSFYRWFRDDVSRITFFGQHR
jgi:hypothetical protein